MAEVGWRWVGGREVFPLPDGEPGGAIGIGSVADWLATHVDRVMAHLERYFRPSSDSGVVYQGQHFEWFSQRSPRTTFGADDLAALGALSVAVPAQTARTLIEDPGGVFGGLLARCAELVASRPGAELATCPGLWLDDKHSPFVVLYNELRRLAGVGPVVCSKLMASKFPALIPIRDDKVEWLLGLERSATWWVPMRDLLLAGKPSVDSILRGLDGGGTFDHVCVLRRLDVALWMEAKSRLPEAPGSGQATPV